MLFKKNNRLTQGVIFTGLLTLLASCGNSEALEGLVGADPELKKARVEQKKRSDNSERSPESSPEATEPASSITEETEATETAETRDTIDADSPNPSPPNNTPAEDNTARQPVAQVSNLPFSFPNSFPVYPQAELQEIESQGDDSGRLVWNMSDNRQAVADYYQAELTANDWNIIKPFTLNPQQELSRAIAVKNELRVELTLSANANSQDSGNSTRLSAVYHPLDEEIPPSSIARTNNAAEPQFNSEVSEATESNQETAPNETEPIPQGYLNSPESNFTDLDEVPEQLQQPLQSLAALGILTPYTREANVELAKFAPNKTITRAEYARWLMAANNLYYSDNPGKKIYVASQNSQSAFQDVKPSHPDYEAIQSLAEAGLIPSRLTEDSTNLLFRPDAPLVREDLITWKVPLDTRQSLPKASIEAIKESWGFQDVQNIDSSAIRALYADFQNGDLSNIRRVFGYTTLFQPKKSVTRAEAAASLGYFGFQGDGITAQEVLESETETEVES